MTHDMVTATEIARLVGVRVSAVSNWRNRHPGFPDPKLVSGQEMFPVMELVSWLDGRRIPQNALDVGEPVGTSYGHRLRRHLGQEQTPGSPVTYSTWSAPLWQLMDRLRSYQSLESAIEHVLGMIYLRRHQSDVWDRLTSVSQPDEIHAVLADAKLHTGPEARHMPLLRPSTYTTGSGTLLLRTIEVIAQLDIEITEDGRPLAGRISDEFIERLEHGSGKLAGHFTPPSIARCMAGILDPGPISRVYDPLCGAGELLVAAADHGNTREPPMVHGQVVNEQTLRLAALNIGLHGGQPDLRLGDLAPFDDRYPGETFDFVITNPPFNLPAPTTTSARNWRFADPGTRTNFAWLQHVVDKLAPGGRAAVLMPNGAASSRNPVESGIRSAMVEAGVVEAVVGLPAGMFRSTGIPTTLWILRGTVGAPVRTSILLVDATRLGTLGEGHQRILSPEDEDKIVTTCTEWRYRDRTTRAADFARPVEIEELRRSDYDLLPRRYLLRSTPALEPEVSIEEKRRALARLRARSADDERAFDHELAEVLAQSDLVWRTAPLGDLCEISAGPAKMDRAGGEPGQVPLVLPRNIRSGGIDHADLDLVPPHVARRFLRYGLIPGDVVCARTGTLGRYGLVREMEKDWLLGPGCMLLRPRSEAGFDPAYLTFYLETPSARGWLNEHATGSAIRYITTDRLRELPVRLPPLSAQYEIVAVTMSLDRHLASLENVRAATAELRAQIIPALGGAGRD